MNGNPCQILVDTGVTLPTLHPTLEPLDGTVRKLAEVGEGRLACLILCPENCLSLLPIAMGGGYPLHPPWECLLHPRAGRESSVLPAYLLFFPAET